MPSKGVMTTRCWVWLLAGWGLTGAVWGDGLMVVHEPPAGRVPGPPPRFTFAPLEVTFHKVDARIRDQVAVTTVDQEFYNPNDRELEGTYLFPVPKGAHLDQFTMEIGGKAMEAELLSAEKARQVYEDIVRKHRDPALMEYVGRDTFRVRVYPIEARSRKRVQVRYTQLLKVDGGLAEYRYPLNTEKFSAQPLRTVSVRVDLETRRPLKAIYSPSHVVDVTRRGETRAVVGYEATMVRPDVDWVLYFGQEAGDLGVNLLTFQPGEGDGFFLLLASPAFGDGGAKVVPKDVVFVLDTSGSMAGRKLEQARKALGFCVESLNEGDRFEVVRFATDAEGVFGRLAEASGANKGRARGFIEGLGATGGTAIQEALQRALGMRPEVGERPFVVIFLTDGLPTVGETNGDKIVASVRREGRENTRVFCFGLGTDVNTHLLDGITEATRAFSQYVMPEEDIEVKVSSFFDRIKAPVLASPSLKVGEGVRLNRMHPGELPDLFRGEQLVVVGRYAGGGGTTLTVEGRVEDGRRRFEYAVDFTGGGGQHEFIARLWATRRVGYLLDEIRLRGESAELRTEVTELARRYGIVTPYTAYLILEDEARRQVPATVQTMPGLREDRVSTEAIAGAYDAMQRERSGGAAVLGARYGLALKQAEAPASALASGNVDAGRSVTVAAAAGLGRGGQSGGAVSAGRIQEHTQQSRRVGGKTFFQNGERWVDGAVQEQGATSPVRLEFGSAAYFELAREQAEVREWLALGRAVIFVHEGRVYEVYE